MTLLIDIVVPNTLLVLSRAAKHVRDAFCDVDELLYLYCMLIYSLYNTSQGSGSRLL